MPIEFWQAVDTALKIGLGAVIAGYTTWRVTRLKHWQAVEETAVRRRLELIEEITAGIADFGNSIARYCLITDNILQAIYPPDGNVYEPSKIKMAERADIEQHLRSGKALERAEGLMYLISADGELPMMLADLQRRAEQVMYLAGGDLDSDFDLISLEQMLSEFKGHSAQLMVALGRVYRSPAMDKEG